MINAAPLKALTQLPGNKMYSPTTIAIAGYIAVICFLLGCIYMKRYARA